MADILFICMPFAAASRGSLGLSTLKAICRESGIPVDIRYLNIPFAVAIGEERYNNLRESIDAELCFTPALFPDISPASLWERYLKIPHLQRKAPGLTENFKSKEGFMEITGIHVPHLLDQAMAEIDWQAYQVIGFSISFFQTTASLALISRIRQKFPGKILIAGGTACEGVMGQTLLESFPELDVVVSGEADHLIVPLLETLMRRQPLPCWPGIHARTNEQIKVMDSCTSMPPLLPGSMDQLPIPDYDDYFAQLKDYCFAEPLLIPFESSRGCWWGQKRQCRFCGTAPQRLKYRSKSPDRIITEISLLNERYQKKGFFTTDFIFNRIFFKTLLPRLKELHQTRGITLFYETKSNLSTQKIHDLRQAGILKVQPGIESFNDHILKVMNKGADIVTQVRFLRDSTAAGLEATYGILWRNPGEKPGDYLEMAELVPFLCHIPPPKYIVPMVLERFSPYFCNPGKFGIRNVRPHPIYHLIFGGRHLDYQNLAYMFAFDHDFDNDPQYNAAWKKCLIKLFDWQSTYKPYLLVYCIKDNVLYIADRRGDKPVFFNLTGWQKDIFNYCENGPSLASLQRSFPTIHPDNLEKFLKLLVQHRLLMVRTTGNKSWYLSLPVMVSMDIFYKYTLHE